MKLRSGVFPLLSTAILAVAGCLAESGLESSEQSLAAIEEPDARTAPGTFEEPGALEEPTALDAGAATLAGCQLYPSPPEWYAASIFGSGWWFDCAAGSTVTVLLRQDRPWWPDRTLRSSSGSGSSGGIDLSYPCLTDFDPIRVYIEVRNGSQKVQSPRVIVPCG